MEKNNFKLLIQEKSLDFHNYLSGKVLFAKLELKSSDQTP